MDMKKYILASLFACVAAFSFTSCEDDNDSNPTISQPESFVLNTPAYAGNVYDLEHSDSLEFTYSQPDYGFTAAVSYYTQFSLSNDWRATDVDADGNEVKFDTPKFVEIDGFTNKAKANVKAEDLNKAIMKMGGYSSPDEVPENTEVYARMKATLNSGYTCYSNVVKLNTKPYYKALTAADPELWYLIGGCVGDGAWGAEIGTSVFPMCPVEGETYDEVTGKGVLTYTGYFTPDAGGFKIVKTPGEWADQWGAVGGDITKPKLKDASGEGDNINVPSAGYYTITLNTKTNELSIVAAEKEPAEYAQMCISGAFNDWGTDTKMTPVDTWDGAKPHVWKYDLTTDTDTEVKFLVDSSWNPNWGGSGFPYGWGANNGGNIAVKAGSYTVIFNDITGYYHFYSK